MTRQKEDLQPLQPGRIGMYVCGDTVFDLCHMGHARSKIAFDVVRRYLRYSGFAVTFVRNITDIDDKIIKRAAEREEPIDTFTERFIALHAPRLRCPRHPAARSRAARDRTMCRA